jgi:hypothetical protein
MDSHRSCSVPSRVGPHWLGGSANLYSSLDPASVVKVAVAAVLIIATAFGAISVLVLGVLDADSTSVAPVAELLGIALGPTGVFVAAALALILTFGNMNAYVAGLGAIGRGLTVGQLPWRIPPLAIPTAIAILSLILTTGKHDAARMLVGVTAASQVPVLLLSCLAALRLLDRFTAAWWSAALASMAVAALLVPAGRYLVAPATIALVTVAGGWWHTRAVLAHHRPSSAGCAASTTICSQSRLMGLMLLRRPHPKARRPISDRSTDTGAARMRPVMVPTSGTVDGHQARPACRDGKGQP